MKNIIKIPTRSRESQSSDSEYSFDFQEERETKPQVSSITQLSSDWLQTLVRVIGVSLLLFGLWAGAKVMVEAFSLYADPVKIESFAVAIEKGSNIDSTFSPEPDEQNGAQQDFRLSYFAAWVIILALLLLISMIAFTAIKTGGELALYNIKIKQLAEELRDNKQ